MNVGGKAYSIQTLTGSFNSNQTILKATPWWGNGATAKRFAEAWFNGGFAGDSSVHLKLIDACRRGEKIINQYVIPNRMSYPILFHQYCLIYNKNLLVEKSYFPNLILFVTFAVILNGYSAYVFDRYLDEQLAMMGFSVSAFLLLSVQHLTTFGPAIAYANLSSRLMGKISTSSSMETRRP